MTCARPNFRPKRSTIHMQELRCDMQETEEIEVRRDMKAAIETSLPHQLFPRLAPATAESATSCSSLCAPRRRKGTSHGGQSLFIRVFVLFSPPTLLSQRGAAMLSFLSTRIGLNPSNRMEDGNDRPAPAAVAHSPGAEPGACAGIERRSPARPRILRIHGGGESSSPKPSHLHPPPQTEEGAAAEVNTVYVQYSNTIDLGAMVTVRTSKILKEEDVLTARSLYI
jgi:hypothetical protein